jgi:hypothetical protein
MILFTILALIIILLVIFSVAVLSVSGAAFIIIFGDFIACGVVIWLIVKLLRRKKRR